MQILSGVVNSSSGSGLSQATKYISCNFKAKFVISNAIKSATVVKKILQEIREKIL